MQRSVMLALMLLAAPVLSGCIGTDEQLDEGSTDDVLPGGLVPTIERVLQIDDRWSGEPSILAMQDGTLLITGAGGMTRYVEDPADAPGNFGQSYLWRSTDDGETWEFVEIQVPGPANEFTPYRNAMPGVEGDLAEDDEGRAYFVDMAMLAGNSLGVSEDSGETWTAVQNPLVGLPGTDRPWVAALGDGEVYVKYLHLAGDFRVARSTDAGQTFLEDMAIPPCGQGDLVVDRAAGHVLVPCNDGEQLFVLRTEAGAPMDWERIDAIQAEGQPNNVFPALAVAGEGEYVYAYAEDFEEGTRARVTWSLDAGETWSEPVTVSEPERTSVFPWVSANADGVVGVVWYQADRWGDPAELDASWWPMHASFQLTEDGATAAQAVVTQLSEDPNHRGGICTSGLGCVLDGRSDDRRLLDFFELDVDAQGTSHITWTNDQTEVPTIWYGQVELRPAGDA